MSAPPVSVSPRRYQAASEIFGNQVHAQLIKVINDVVSGLAGTAGMAGTDPGGEAWAEGYDRAANGVASVLVDLDVAAMMCADLLERSGFNHGMAESASDPRQTVPTPPDTRNYSANPSPVPRFPSAQGVPGQNGLPPLVVDWLKYVWVDGDTGKLKAASGVWKSAGNSIRGAGSSLLPEAFAAVNGQQSPEVPEATAVLNDFQQELNNAAGACDDLSGSCNELAARIDSAHDELVEELQNFVATTIAIEAGGALSSLVTFGGGELVAQGLEAARLAKAAERVNSIVKALANSVKTVAASVKNVVTKVGEIAKRLAPFKNANSLEAETQQAKAVEGTDDSGPRPDDPLPRHADGSPLSTSEAKSVRSLEGNIAEHEQKLADYERDPYAYDNKGILKNAPNDAVRQQIIQGRIRHLKTEINTFRENIQKIIGG